MSTTVRQQIPAPADFFIAVGTASGQALASAGNKMALIFMADKSASVDRVRGYVTSVTNGGGNPVYDVRIETVNSSGEASGTLAGTNTNGTLTVSAAGAWTVTLTANASLTEGTLYAVVIAATTVGATQQATFTKFGNNVNAYFPYISVDTTGSYVRSSGAVPLFGAQYTDNSVAGAPRLLGNSTNGTIATLQYNTGSTPDEVGTYWPAPVDSIEVGGFILGGGVSGTSADFALVLYDASNNVLKSIAMDADAIRATGADNMIEVHCAAVTVTTAYRVVLKPTTANSVRLVEYRFPASTSILAQFTQGQKTSRADAGSWTQDAVLFPCIAPIIITRTAAAASGGTKRRPW